MKYTLVLLALVFSASTACLAQQLTKAQLRGKITHVTDSEIKIGEENVPVAEDGRFRYTMALKQPTLLDVSYAGQEWTVFLQAGKTLEMVLPGKEVAGIRYAGNPVSPNAYLLEVHALSEQINASLRQRWVRLHRQDPASYLAAVDSVKNLYLEHLADTKNYRAFPKEFISAWKAELNLSFNALMLGYPERHRQYTGNKVSLNQQQLNTLTLAEINDPASLGLPSYKKYVKALLDNLSEVRLSEAPLQQHYNLAKTAAVLQLIPELITNPYLRDFWRADYLKEHLDKNGLANSSRYIAEYLANVQTAEFRQDLEQYVQAVKERRKDHAVRVYKTVNGYQLEAHLFRPSGFSAAKSYPAIAIFHGGGWYTGSPAWAFDRAQHFAEQGMVGIAVQYRLSNFRDVTPLEAMQDAKDLFLWLRTHADSLGINPHKIAAEGWSAGGHLVTSAAVFADTLSNSGISSAPNVLILKSPVLDTDSKNDSWLKTLLGVKEIDPLSLSPLQHVAAGRALPPTLILQGRTDSLTPTRYAQQFHEKMLAADYQCELVIYEDCGHLFTPSHLNDRGWPQSDKEISRKANEKADGFLKSLGYIGE